MLAPQRHVKRKIREPGLVAGSKGEEIGMGESTRAVKTFKGGTENALSLCKRATAIRPQQRCITPSSAGQIIQINQERVPRMRREALIRRAVAMGRINGERLPDGHAGRDQKINEPVGRRSQVPVMETPRKRCDMEENPRASAVENAVRLRHVRRSPQEVLRPGPRPPSQLPGAAGWPVGLSL